MGFSLKKLGSRIYDQVNMFDNNRTFKQRAPTQSKSVVQQAGQLGGQFARSSVGGIAKMANTAAVQVPQAYYTGTQALAARTNNTKAYENATRNLQATESMFNRNKGGLLNAGTLYNTQEAQQGSLNTGLKRVGGGTLQGMAEAYTLGKGAPVGASIMELGLKKGLIAVAPELAKTFSGNVAQGAITAANQGASAKDVFKSAALSGVLGSAGDIGLGVAGAAVHPIVTGTAGKVYGAVKPKVNIKPLDQSGSVRLPFTKGQPGDTLLDVKNPLGAKVTKQLDINNPLGAKTGLEVNNPLGARQSKVTVKNNTGAPLKGEGLSGAAQQSYLAKNGGLTNDFNSPEVRTRMMKDYLEGKPPVKGSALSGEGMIPPKNKIFKPLDQAGGGATADSEVLNALRKAKAPKDTNVEVKNGLGAQLKTAFVEKDQPIIGVLKQLEKKSGKKGLVDQFMYDSGLVSRSDSIANAKLANNPNLKAAFDGLSKKELNRFNEYSSARSELYNASRGLPTTRPVNELQATVDSLSDNAPRFDSLNKFYKDYAKDLYDGGIITPEKYQQFISSPDYVRTQRDMADLIGFKNGTGGGYSLGSSMTSKKRIGSKNREILPADRTAFDYAQKAQAEIQRNQAASNLIDTLEGTNLISPIRIEENVLTRQSAYKFLSETKPGKDLVQRLLKTKSRELRVLESEVNKLNKEGLSKALKGAPQAEKPKVSVKTTVKRLVGTDPAIQDLKSTGKWKIEKPVDVQTARTALNGSTYLNSVTGELTDKLNKYAKANKITPNEAIVEIFMKRKGADAYLRNGKEVVLNNNKVKNHTVKLVSEGKLDGKILGVSANDSSRMTSTKVKQTISTLFQEDPQGLQRIRDKIARREPKVAALIDEITNYTNEAQAFKTLRSQAFQEARAAADLSATNKNTIKRIKNGITEIYEVDPEIKQAVDHLAPYQLGLLQKIVSAPKRIFQAGTTGLSAPFTIANYVKDQIGSGINSKSIIDTHNPVNIMKGLYEASKDFGGAKNSEAWNRFLAHSGDTTQFDLLRGEKNAAQLSRELRMGGVGKTINRVLSPIKTLEDAVSITEKATRYQNFLGMENKLLSEGATKPKALQEATLAAWQNSTDFNRYGDWAKTINLLVPYFNSGIQGTRQLTRAFKTRPVATTIKTMATVGMPLLSSTAYNLSDPERKKVYDNISEFEKENNFILIPPNSKQNKDGTYDVYKLPMPFGYSNLMGPARRAMVSFANNSPQDWAKISTDIMGAFSGPINTNSPQQAVAGLIPQAIKPLVQQAANKDFFTGKDIVPEYVNKATDAQGNPVPENKKALSYTSGSAQIIGNLSGQSPIRVEKFFKDTFGKIGQYGVNTVDNTLAKLGIIKDSQIGGVSAMDDISRRFTKAQGNYNYEKSAGGKYYDAVKEATKGLDANEQAAYSTLHPSKSNFLGEDIFDENKRLTKYARAGIYLQFPDVYQADKRLNDIQAKQGNPSNPLYELAPEQLTRVLLKATLPPGSKDPELSALYQQDWYQDYNAKRSKYYDQIKNKMAKEGKTLPPSDNPYPETPKNIQKLMDTYSSLPKGTGARSAWIRANPTAFKSMTNQWAAVDAWENKERLALGLSEIANDTQTSTYGNSSGSSGGGGGRTASSYYGKSKSSVKGKVSTPSIKGKTPVKLKGSVKTVATSKPKVTIKKSLV